MKSYSTLLIFFLVFSINSKLLIPQQNVVSCATNSSNIQEVGNLNGVTWILKVLLVEFSDIKHKTPGYTITNFNNLFFSNGIYVSPNMYSPDGEQVFGSMRDYYSKVSNGQFTLTGSVVNKDDNHDNIPDWLTLPSTKAYYDASNYDQFITDVYRAANAAGIDITTNSTTKLAIIYAGQEYRDNRYGLTPQQDGDNYINSELFAPGPPFSGERSEAKFSEIGTNVHEFGHIFGWLDYYYDDNFGNGYWDLMATGNFNGPNGRGACPSPPNPELRSRQNWLSFNNITSNTTVQSNYNLSNPQVYQIINSSDASNYWLIETRNFNSTMQVGSTNIGDYNTYTPHGSLSHGVLVWRINYENYAKKITLLHASGVEWSWGTNGPGYDGDPYPGSANVKVLSPYTDSRTPNPNFYWVPNTQPSTNVGMEIMGENSNYFTLNLYYNTPPLPLNISGDLTINANCSIASGVTSTIPSGATLNFLNGASLIVNGTLTANGGSASTPITFNFGSPNSSVHNGIAFNSGSSGTINYCIVRNADRGIYENSVSVNITNSAVSNCTDGIYLYSSNPLIQYCDIHNNSFSGLNLTYSSPIILWGNHIHNNSDGVFCSTSSNPKFGNGIYDGEDDIRNNTFGVVCYNNAYPVIGRISPLDGGFNNLENNITANVYNMCPGVVYAEDNWWGTSNPAYFNISGTVSYANYKYSEFNVPSAPLSKSSGGIAGQVNGSIPMLSELNKAYQMVADSNYMAAKAICLNLVNNYPNYSVSYNALNLLKQIYPADEIDTVKNVYSSLFSNNKGNKKLKAMAGLILGDIDKGNRLNHINDVINSYAQDSVVELALFDKFVYYHFDRGDKQNALVVSKQLDNMFPLSMGAITAHQILGDTAYYNMNLAKKPASQETTEQFITEYKLLDNFPNPFNPTTVISYQLPKDGVVSLKVYDILGKELKTLVEGYKTTGKYSVSFDASHLASGIYFYQLRAGSFISNKKMLLIK